MIYAVQLTVYLEADSDMDAVDKSQLPLDCLDTLTSPVVTEIAEIDQGQQVRTLDLADLYNKILSNENI